MRTLLVQGARYENQKNQTSDGTVSRSYLAQLPELNFQREDEEISAEFKTNSETSCFPAGSGSSSGRGTKRPVEL